MYRGIGNRSTRRSYTRTDVGTSATCRRERKGKTNLGIRDGILEELLEVLVPLLVLVARLAPLRDRLTVEDEDVEEGVEEQDDVRLDRHAVEQHGLWWHVERVRHERRLDHDERVVHVLLIQYMPATQTTPH